MAQGNPRSRHGRHQSRILRMVNSGNISQDESDAAKSKQSGNHEQTVRYIKRILCQSASRKSPLAAEQDLDTRPLDELLPPLTSSNEVDVQLYAIIAVILSNFVQTWYNRITPDQDFVAEVVQIIAHCTRGLEQRLRQLDLEDLLLDELPAILVSHVKAVRIAQNACPDSASKDGIRLIYSSMKPNEALTPLPNDAESVVEQDENESAWSQLLVSRVLPLVLPPEDLQNPCLHVLMSEIFSEMIVHRVLCQRVSEPWLLWEGITKAIYALRHDLAPRPTSEEASTPVGRREQFGLLSSRNAAAGEDQRWSLRASAFDRISGALWAALQFSTIAWLFLRSLVVGLMHASTLPHRSSHAQGEKTSDKPPVTAVGPSEGGPDAPPSVTRHAHAVKRPVVGMRVWSCASTLTALDQRMPWVIGFFSLLQWLSLRGPGQLCRTDGPLDRLMASQIQAKLLRPEYLPPLLQAIRLAIFPDNTLAEARVPPTVEQVEEIKRVCAETIVRAVPESVRNRFFATTDFELMRKDVTSTLELFEDQYINKHLIIDAVELLIVRLCPELSEEGGLD